MTEAPQRIELSENGPPTGVKLGLWDAISVIVGIVVGASIYKVSPIVFQNVASAGAGIGLWVLGGGLSLLGAFCYAELATTYPRSGGDYVYLTRAYGPLTGFLFGWAHLGGILTGSIGAMAFVFAEYAQRLFSQTADPSHEAAWAIAAILLLTVLNLLGVVLGKFAQNVLTVVKVIGLTAIVLAGMIGSSPDATDAAAAAPRELHPSIAIIVILYAFGGWNDAAFVAAEVRDTRRNLPRALVLGLTIVTAVYLLVNAAYLKALGVEGLRSSTAPAADVLGRWLGKHGERAMSAVVMVSSLGALNGLIFTGSRVHASMGADHRLFAWLGRWNGRLGTPVASLLTQAAVSATLIGLVGTAPGRDALDALFRQFGGTGLPWDKYYGGFNTLVAATAPTFWLFFLLTGLSVFVLRAKDGPIIRPFRAPLYPLTPLLFCMMCAGMVYASVDYARGLALVGTGPLLAGIPAYFFSRMLERAKAAPTLPSQN